MNNCLIISRHSHGFVTSVTLWIIILTNEYTSLANAHYYLLSPQFYTHK